MAREKWQGKVLTVYEINCADCDASDFYRGPRGTRQEAHQHWRSAGWRLSPYRGEAAEPSLWRCPAHERSDDAKRRSYGINHPNAVMPSFD